MKYKIPKKQKLPFIENRDLYKHVGSVLKIADDSMKEAENRIYSNVIDPFSALFDAMTSGTKLSDWLIKEKTRQSQKTIQNALGKFHQDILGSLKGCKNLESGQIVDLVNNDKRIIAEIKNKYNTTKGNHKVAIYDDLKNLLENKYKGFVGYYVEIIPKNKKEYNKEFTPPDNRTSKRRPANKNIRIIDGKSFYELLSNDKQALKKLYESLPEVIGDILGTDSKIKTEEMFKSLFTRTYS